MIDADTIIEGIRYNTPKGVIIGLSGGLDSSVVAALAVQALGTERVHTLHMPTDSTPVQDLEDVDTLINKLGLTENFTLSNIQILLDTISPELDKTVIGNLSARLRMSLLYMHANAYGLRVLGTSDRSEYEIGYFTKWGDGVADYYPIIHLYKTEVRQLARQLGIPHSIIDKPSSPALWNNQTAEGEIGFSYEDIDAMLKGVKPMHPDLQARIDSTKHKRNSS